METVRLTVAQAIVRYLMAQRIDLDGEEAPLFPGVFAIFGHGNVTSLGEALQAVEDELPTWRGQNEETMAMAAVAYAKAKRRRQIMVATSSIGPGTTNMLTAAGIAHADRLPLLLLAGDTFASRVPDPVLQQIEQFHDPSITVNDAFRPVTRYWDRINSPAQWRRCSTLRTAGRLSSDCLRTSSRGRSTTRRSSSSGGFTGSGALARIPPRSLPQRTSCAPPD